MTSQRFLAIVCTVAMLVPAGAAWADLPNAPDPPILLAQMDGDEDRDRDRDQDQDRDRDRVTDRLRDDYGLTDREADRLRERVDHHLKNGGTEQNLRQMVQVAVRNNCRDACLDEAVRAMNRDMHRGATPMQARDRVEKAIRAAAEQGKGGDMADRLRDRLELRDRDEQGIRDRDDRGGGMGGMGGMGGGRR